MLKKQAFYFLIIGALASIVNFILVFIIVHLGLAKPLVANFFAFLIAFNISYFGHRFLTFSTTTLSHTKAGSQFFITLVPTPHLNGRHTVFGKIVEGLEVVLKIGEVETGQMDRPKEDVVMEEVTIIRPEI